MIRTAQRGFTLIELVVVIVILGILAAFAVPRFMGLEDQARVAAVNAMAGSLRSAATMAHGVWEASGTPAAITVPGAANTVTILNGYPTANARGVVLLLQDTSGFTVTGGGTIYTPNGAKTSACQVTYVAATATVPFTLTFAGLAPTATPAQVQTALQNAC